jgi:PAS domain S-box-containing protein
MLKILLLSLLLVNIIFAKEVLVLHSYHKGYVWSDEVSKAIEENLKNENLNITTEYMDTKYIYSYEYKLKLFDFLLYKYKNKKFDVIIASDNTALNFLENFHDKIFVDTPIVFCGINNLNKQLFHKTHIKNRTTGVVESVDIKKNIDLILKLHPKLSKLLVVNDITVTGREIKEEFFNVIVEYDQKIPIEYLDDFNTLDLQKKVKELDSNSVILFLFFFKDSSGKEYSVKDGFNVVSSVSNVPIYGLWDFYLPYGMMGGYLTNGYAQGETASKLVKKILEGSDVKNLPIINKSPNKYMFDYHKLKEFDITMRDLPRKSILLNQTNDFYMEYKYELTLLFFVFLIALFAIFFLYLALLEKRKTKQELQIQLQFIQTLLDTISMPIFYKNRKGIYLGCNKAFCKFLGMEKEDILGKTIYDLFEGQQQFLKDQKYIEKKLFLKESIDEYLMEYHTPNGKKQMMLVSKSLYYDLKGNVKGVLTVLHDITALSQAQETKKQQESFLVQQSKLAEIGEMISAIAHQWNEPLVEMSAIVQDLELQFETEGLEKKDMDIFVKDSMTQIQYMSKTLKDFRDFLKPSIKRLRFDMKDAFSQLLNIIERQIKYSYIDINIKYCGENLYAYGYKNELMQVLITIINNAKDAIIKQKEFDKNYNGIIDIVVDSVDGKTRIIISDNGCGIDDKHIKKIFEPYFSTKENGNGIGLYMSKVLIEEKMNGKIEVTSEPFKTQMIIQLPKKENDEDITT